MSYYADLDVSTIDELQLVHEYLACNFLLANDIDLTGVDFEPFGSDQSYYTATFDGGNNEISNWTYSSTVTNVSVALFVSLDNATLKNLTVSNVNVSSSGYAAALAANVNSATIINCHSSGTVTGASYVGGLVAYGVFATITSSSSSANVTGGEQTGGLVGLQLFSPITHSNASGIVNGGDWTGGLVGWDLYGSVEFSFATGDVSNDIGGGGGDIGGLIGFYSPDGNVLSDSYATGSVRGTTASVGGLVGETENEPGTFARDFAIGKVTGSPAGGLLGSEEDGGELSVSNCFWDSDTTTQSTSSEGTQESDVAMQTQATYTGFDFTNVWIMSSSGYPTLR